MNYNELSKRQASFVHALCHLWWCYRVHSAGTHGCLRLQHLLLPSFVDHAGLARKVERGVYSVPECAEHWDSADAPTPVGADAPAATIAPAVVEQSVPNANLAASVMGMTGGDRATLIPERMTTYVPWGHFGSVEKILKANIFYPVFVTGLSGNGKTTMIEQGLCQDQAGLFPRQHHEADRRRRSRWFPSHRR